MPDYKFCVSLNISHPEIFPSEITEQIKLSPENEFIKGRKRVTPNGRVLNSCYENMFWSCDLTEGMRVDAHTLLFEEFIEVKNKELSQHKEYFYHIRKTGGSVEYFVGWFSDDSINMNIYLEPEILSSTANLNIGIVLCAYPSSKDS